MEKMFVIKLVFVIFCNADLNTSVLQMDCAVTISGTLRFISLSTLSYVLRFSLCTERSSDCTEQ